MLLKSLLPVAFLLGSSFALAAPPENDAPEIIPVQSHAGEMDTDGILSEGERRNPSIDYDRAKRDAEKRGDERFDNRYNDSAAERDRDSDARGRYEWDEERRDRDEYGHDRDYERDSSRQPRRSWWNWWD